VSLRTRHPGTVVVAGALAQRPGRAGHAWVFLNWMLGFRGLGYDVVFVDRMAPELGDVDAGVTWVETVMNAVGFEDAWSVAVGPGTSAGLSRATVLARSAGAVLFNVMGYLDDDDVLAAAATRVFLDIDPGFGQAWQQTGSATLFAGHDAYATVGMNVGREGCGVPDLGLDWVPTLPPVDLDHWSPGTEHRDVLTTIASWRGPFAPVEIGGVVHGLRVHEARRYADLPSATGAAMEIALDIDPSDERDRRALCDGGWQLVDATLVGADLAAYRRYIGTSLGEFAIAKQAYVQLRTGWFSDRSACYLASGPVIVSDTGLADHLPLGEGLLVHDDPAGAATAVEDVLDDPARHRKAARLLAEEHFEARTVARALLERVA